MIITRRPSLFTALLVVTLAVAGLGPIFADQMPLPFSGHYDWRDGGRGDLRVEFEPDGDSKWLVAFRFRFDGKNNTWKGTASGSLEDGSELTGTAKWGSRKWTWTASISDGVMRGQHTELRSRGKTYETGTFEVSR